jgi:hypothetical protein
MYLTDVTRFERQDSRAEVSAERGGARKYAKAREEANIDGMVKYAIVLQCWPRKTEESKRLLNALGIAVVPGPAKEDAVAQMIEEGRLGQMVHRIMMLLLWARRV